MAKKTAKTEKSDAKKGSDEVKPAAPTKRLTNAEANARLLVMRATMEKEFGKGIIQNLGAQVSNQRFAYQVPTGSVSLDVALGPVMRNFGRGPLGGYWRIGEPEKGHFAVGNLTTGSLDPFQSNLEGVPIAISVVHRAATSSAKLETSADYEE